MVGFGGGSSYLAILILAGFSYQKIPSLALICNLIVASCGFFNFARAGHFRMSKTLPFIILSIPCAYVGARVHIGQRLFGLLLGLALLAVAVRMFIPEREYPQRPLSRTAVGCIALPSGALLGFAAGLLGIGGGIFLSPLLIALRWTHVKEAGASASFFILVNSLAGLAGHFQKDMVHFSSIFPLSIAVFLGGQWGSRVGAFQIPLRALSRVMGVLIFAASFKLILEAL